MVEKAWMLEWLGRGTQSHHGGKGKVTGAGRPGDHLSIHTQEAEREEGSEVRLLTFKTHPQWQIYFPHKAPPREDSITSPKNTNWGPSVQAHEPLGDISHSNPNRSYESQGYWITRIIHSFNIGGIRGWKNFRKSFLFIHQMNMSLSDMPDIWGCAHCSSYQPLRPWMLSCPLSNGVRAEAAELR